MCLLEFWYVVLSIKCVVLSRPRIMIWHICSMFVYIFKFVISTFIFIGANAIFQILSLKCVFGTHIISWKFFVEVLLQIETSSKNFKVSLKPKVSFWNLVYVLIQNWIKSFKLKNINFVLLGFRGAVLIPL